MPSLLLFTLFVVGPALVGLYLSFTNYHLVKAPELVGLVNYARLFRDPDVQQAAGNTVSETVFAATTILDSEFVKTIKADLMQGLRSPAVDSGFGCAI